MTSTAGRCAQSKTSAGRVDTNALLNHEGRLHPLRQIRYPLRVRKEADDGVLAWVEIDQNELTLIAGGDGCRTDVGHLPGQVGTAGAQQIGCRETGRKTEHQHLVVFVGVIGPAQDDVRTRDRRLIQAERAIADLNVNRRRTGGSGDRLLPLPSKPPRAFSRAAFTAWSRLEGPFGT